MNFIKKIIYNPIPYLLIGACLGSFAIAIKSPVPIPVVIVCLCIGLFWQLTGVSIRTNIDNQT